MPREISIKPEAITDRRRVLVGILVFFVVAGSVAFTARDPGLTWDEAIYHDSAQTYRDWFRGLHAEPFRKETIFAVWGQPDHPPLAKLWIALSMSLFGGGPNDIAASRVGTGILFGAIASLLYLWLSQRKGDLHGGVAAIAFALTPRIFAHGHFATIEMPMLLLWLLTTIAFEKGIKSRRWSVLCGVFFGLALLTKINAVFLPVVLVPWGLIFHGRKALPNVIFMAVLGPVIFFVGWPVMWYHPILATRVYLADKVGRAIVETHYLGATYSRSCPPWHYPFVMLLATTPLPILAASGTALWRFARRLRRRWRELSFETLIVWSFAFHVLLLAVPGVPKYDGIRLMLPAYPFLAVLAALGVVWAWERLRPRLQKPRKTAAILGAVGALWLLAPVVIFHPFQLCYYGELVGGPWGARRIGFETTYWHDTFNRDALRYLNDHARGKPVALVPIEYRVWRIYQEQGELDKPMGHTNYEDMNWDYLVVVPRQGKLSAGVRKLLKENKPVWVQYLSPFRRLPVCMIFRRERSGFSVQGSRTAE